MARAEKMKSYKPGGRVREDCSLEICLVVDGEPGYLGVVPIPLSVATLFVELPPFAGFVPKWWLMCTRTEIHITGVF